MTRVTTQICADALTVIENGLREGGTLNLNALYAFNAGISFAAANGMEPSDNSQQALRNLVDELVISGSSPEEASAAEGGGGAQAPSEGVQTPPAEGANPPENTEPPAGQAPAEGAASSVEAGAPPAATEGAPPTP